MLCTITICESVVENEQKECHCQRRFTHPAAGPGRSPAPLLSRTAPGGCSDKIISDHGKQFDSHAFRGANCRLQITHTIYERGHPWQNLIERQFGIQAKSEHATLRHEREKSEPRKHTKQHENLLICGVFGSSGFVVNGFLCPNVISSDLGWASINSGALPIDDYCVTGKIE